MTNKPSLKVIRDMAHRDMEPLINTEREGRIGRFNTPSSFYVQLFEEDPIYDAQDRDLNESYDNLSKKYCCDECPEVVDVTPIKELSLEKLERHMYIAVKIAGRWGRYLTGDDDARFCRAIDSGSAIELTQEMEKDGLFELEGRFLALPPRVILCGLYGLMPKSSSSRYRWKKKACDLISDLVQGRTMKIFFAQKGLFNDSCYVLFACREKDGTVIHANWLLVAFDLAYHDTTGTHQSLWLSDAPY